MATLLIAGAVGALFTVAFSAYIQPRWIVSKLQERYPDVFFCTKTEKKIVALTIDDGPTANVTPGILDVLREHDCKCTFFLIGERIVSDGNEAIVQRIRDEGHELGNHTWTNSPSWKLPIPELEDQLKKVDALLYPEGDYQQVKCFRPGHGWFSKEMVAKAKEIGYRTVLGDIYPHDPIVASSYANSTYVLNRVHPGGVIILHDGKQRMHTVETLKIILPKLKEMGYEVTTVSSMIEQTR
jgi:peptidoglycan/xylan/chitin deacetylase (PgdA/CDA1 family)